MTPKERAAMQQALKCAERCESIDGMYSWADTITALREALGENNGTRNVDGNSEHSVTGSDGGSSVSVTSLAEQAEQRSDSERMEPVWYARKDQLQKCVKSTGFCEISSEPRQDRIALYTHPVRTKDLTDDEIEEIGKSYFDEWSFGFARAVIAADREKNK